MVEICNIVTPDPLLSSSRYKIQKDSLESFIALRIVVFIPKFSGRGEG